MGVTGVLRSYRPPETNQHFGLGNKLRLKRRSAQWPTLEKPMKRRSALRWARRRDAPEGWHTITTHNAHKYSPRPTFRGNVTGSGRTRTKLPQFGENEIAPEKTEIRESRSSKCAAARETDQTRQLRNAPETTEIRDTNRNRRDHRNSRVTPRDRESAPDITEIRGTKSSKVSAIQIGELGN